MKYLYQPIPPITKTVLLGTTLLMASLLSACGGSSSNNDNEHTDTDIQSDGRLAMYDADAKSLKVLNLDDGSKLERFALDGSTPRLYPLPGNRYTAALQRDDNKVSFVDSGLYTEDHGDHLHDYAKVPRMLDFTLSGVKPTHFETDETSAVVFNDGDDNNVASVTVFSAASAAAGQTEIELNRENNMHGVAKLIGGQLFVTYRDVSIADTTLPAEVERYSVTDGLTTLEKRYDAQCPRLHGADYNHDVLVFGCSDGILAIDLQDSDYAATKYGNPKSMSEDSRIATVYGHHDVERLVTQAGSQLFATVIENDVVTYQELMLDEGITGLSRNFTPNGEFFWVLGDNGMLYLWKTAGTWEAPESMVISNAELGSVYVASSTTSHMLYVLDADNRNIVEVNYEAKSVGRSFPLNFSASGLSWMGLAKNEHDHNHE